MLKHGIKIESTNQSCFESCQGIKVTFRINRSKMHGYNLTFEPLKI